MPKTKPTPNPSPSTKRGGWRGRNPALPVLVPHTLTVALTRTRSGAPTVLLASLLGTARSVALWWRSRSARITSGSDCERASNSVLRLSLVGCGERRVRYRVWSVTRERAGVVPSAYPLPPQTAQISPRTPRAHRHEIGRGRLNLPRTDECNICVISEPTPLVITPVLSPGLHILVTPLTYHPCSALDFIDCSVRGAKQLARGKQTAARGRGGQRTPSGA